MANIKELIAELKMESANTRKMLERVPSDKMHWRMHEKSMTLGRLASHIAEIPEWATRVVTSNEFDFATANFIPHVRETTEELLQVFDEKLKIALDSLEKASDASLNDIWIVRRGDQVFYKIPKKVVLRNFALNHLYHHRGQLSVYLRMLDIPVPGMYGPSADER